MNGHTYMNRIIRHFYLCSAAVAALGVVGAFPVRAQDTGTPQLPPDLAQQQIPQSFAPDEGAVPVPGTETESGTALSGEEKAEDGAGRGVQNISAEEPAAESVPAQPESRRLVPATAMGADAQSADNIAEAAREGATASAVDAAAADNAAGQAMPDLLEQYRQREQNLRPAGTSASGDALPQVDTLDRIRLEGEFDTAGDNVTMDLNQGMTPEEQAALQEEIRTEAFDAAITGLFPLEPEQIKRALERYDETQRAAKQPVYDLPTPEISVQNVSLDPGVMPPVIKTAVGNVTTLNILDATGAPWPVQDVTWAGDYEIVEPEEGGHIIRITPLSHFARGNIVVRLLTLKTPLTLTLETGRDVVQYRVDARIPEYGPFANAPLMQGGTSLVAGNSELTAILDGVAPAGAVKLHVSGVDGRTTAYSLGGTTYVRTPLTLLSPAWQSSVSSADGMNVYALSSAPVILLSDGGEFQRAVLREKEDLLDDQ